MKTMMSKYKKVLAILWGLTLIVGVLLSVYYLRTHAMTFKEGVILVRTVIKSGLMSLGVFAPLVYIIIYIIRPLIFFPTSILTPLSAVVFGPLLGWVYTFVGENIAASVAFLVARYFGGDMLSRFKKLTLINDELKEHGLRTTIFLRLVPLFPFDVVNFGLGLTSLSFRTYVLGTMLGVLPGLTVYIFLGSSLVSGKYIIPTIIGFVLLSVLANFLRKRNKEVVIKLF